MSSVNLGKQTLDSITGAVNGDLLGSSISLDFNNTRVAIGQERAGTNNSGDVSVYHLQTATSWTTEATFSCPSSIASSRFGHSVSMDWDGTRVAVGAPDHSNGGKVFIYDYNTSTSSWPSGASYTIDCPSSDSTNGNFGTSISIAQGDKDLLAIGNPNKNTVYVYKFSGSSWTNQWSNIGDDIENILPYDSTSNVTMNTNFSGSGSTAIKSLQYGFSVKMAAFGDTVVIGAPGIQISGVTTSNSDISSSKNNIDGSTHFFGNPIRQLGAVRVFKSSDASWDTNTAQKGSLLTGWEDGKNVLITGMPYQQAGTYRGAWPAMGHSVSCDYTGDIIIVGKPWYTSQVQQVYHNGRVTVYEYNQNGSDWVQRGDHITGTQIYTALGWDVGMSYDGTRIAISILPQWGFPQVINHQIWVLDWTGSVWVECEEKILTAPQNGDYKVFGGYRVDISSGSQVAVSQIWHPDNDLDAGTNDSPFPRNDNAKGQVRFYEFTNSSTFYGNNLFQGYIGAGEILIGTNDNATDNTKPKRIRFGGTYQDNEFEETQIENRVVEPETSELLLYKRHSTNEKVDRIRLKASEIHLNHMRMYHSVFQNGLESKIVQTPRFILDQYGTIAIGNLYSTNDSTDSTTSLAETYFDIKAETQIRDKLNVNFKNRSKLLSGHKAYVYMNTRCEDLISSSQIIDETPGVVRVMSINGSGVNYSSTEKAFEFTNTSSGIGISNMASEGHGNWNGDDGMMMFWLKLKDDHSNYTSSNVLCSWGETLSTDSNYKGGCLQLTSTGLKINLGSSIGTRTHTTTLDTNKWYHIGVRFPTETTNMVNALYINGSSVSLSGSVTNSSSSPNWDSRGWHFGYNSRVSNSGPAGTYIGNMIFLEDLSTDLLTYAYNDGPPTECLSVGGDAIIENKLGIGSSTSPSKTLEVTGNVNVISGNIYQNNNILWPATSSGVDIYHNIGKVGIGTSTPGVPLDISYSSSTNGIQLTAGSITQNSIIQVKAASGGSGDPLLSLSCDDGSGSAWCVGIDNSDSDKFVIANDENNLTSSQYIKCGGDEIDLKKRIVINGSAGSSGQVLTSGGSTGAVSWTTVSGGSGGGSSPWTTSGTNVYIQNADIGIETTSPNAQLDVDGHIHCKSIQTGTSRYEQHLVKGNLIKLKFNNAGASTPDSQSAMDTYFESLNSGTKSLSRPRLAATSPGDSTFAETFEGYLKVTTAGTHYFGLNSDDASDMYINGILVAYWYGGHGHNSTTTTPGGNTGDIYLKTGYHKIFVRFQENSGGEALYSLWKYPTGTNQWSSWSEIPGDNCFYDYIRYN